MNEDYSKAVFVDKFGVSITVIVPFTPEQLYALWNALKVGAKVTILVKAGKRALRLDLKDLDVRATFASILSLVETLPAPPEGNDPDVN